MSDSLTDKYPEASFNPAFATFGRNGNTYTGADCPERIDYLMFWARPGLSMHTSDFSMPLYVTKGAKKTVSISDHEPLKVRFEIFEHYPESRNFSAIMRAEESVTLRRIENDEKTHSLVNSEVLNKKYQTFWENDISVNGGTHV